MKKKSVLFIRQANYVKGLACVSDQNSLDESRSFCIYIHV